MLFFVSEAQKGGVFGSSIRSSKARKGGVAKIYPVEFAGLPLGIDVESAISQKNLFVKGSNDDRVIVGSQIIKVNFEFIRFF